MPVAATADLAVVGAGIVGLSVAWEGVRRGLTVVVLERDDRAVGATVRNFGHGCVSAQTGMAREYAAVARERWLELRDKAGLWVQECGTVVVARSEEEAAVLGEFAGTSPGAARLLDPYEVAARVPVVGDEVVGGALLPADIRVDPRTAAAAFATYLSDLGVRFLWSTAALGAESGLVRTGRGDVTARHVVLAPGHDLDHLLPAPCADAGLRRCQLHMMRVGVPAGFRLEPGLLTGTSLLRYDGFLACPSSDALRNRLAADSPGLLAAGVNLMFTQTPGGDLIVGDTHEYGQTPSPFAAAELDSLLLAETRRLFGVPVEVRERWLGTYASTPTGCYLTPTGAPGVVGVAVTSGIGMTTALGLAPAVLDQLLVR